VWESFAIAEIRKRLLALGNMPPLWFWRTANGDEVDLLVETAPETFLAIECKAAEHVTRQDLVGAGRLSEEYGTNAVRQALVACRSARAYPLAHRSPVASALPVGGPDGVLGALVAAL